MVLGGHAFGLPARRAALVGCSLLGSQARFAAAGQSQSLQGFDALTDPAEGIVAQRRCSFYQSHAYPATYNVELNVSCAERDGGGLELRASRSFPAGEIVAWVPENVLIWEPTIPWPLRHAVAHACAAEPSSYAEAVLAVALLAERRDIHSRFKHFVAALAQVTLPEMRNIAMFANDHLAVLNVTRPDLVDALQSGMRCIEKATGALPSLKEQPPTRGEQLWAYALVRSRALKVRGRWVLAPVLDLAEHAYEDEVGGDMSPSVELVSTTAGVALRSLRPLDKGDAVTLSYGKRASNMELLALRGFVVAGNRNSVALPVDFGTLFDGGVLPPSSDSSLAHDQNVDTCEEALRSPQLQRGVADAARTALPFGDSESQCLLERARKYYASHRDEIGFVTDVRVEIQVLELVGGLCQQILQRYRDLAGTLNRLQQHGQRAQDWLTLQLVHEAVEDMRSLEACVGAAAFRAAETGEDGKSDL